jgi:hypothetical protein
MDKNQLENIKKWIETLNTENGEKQGALDALEAILNAKQSIERISSPELPPETPIDPDLKKPDTDKPTIDDTEFEDPDNILKDIKDPEKGEDTSDEEDKTSESSEEEEKESEKSSSDENEIDDTDLLSDKEKELVKDHEKEEKEAVKDFGRKVNLSSAIKQLKKAENELTKDPTKEEESGISKEDLENTRKELEDILDGLKSDKEKTLEKYSEDDINTKINDALDKASKCGVGSKKFSDEEVKVKFNEIEAENTDELSNDDLSTEDSGNLQLDPERAKLKAREAEKERLKKEIDTARTSSFAGNIEKFKEDLKKAIGDQIAEMIEQEEDTYSIPDRHHEDDGIMTPGIRIEDIPDYKKPSIDVYIDQSGSWSDLDVKKAMSAIKEILKFEEQDLLTLNIYYFSEILSTSQEAARLRGSQECWGLIIDNILTEPKPKNVIIVTDSDIGYSYNTAGHLGCIKDGRHVTVDGVVWFLWKDSRRVPEASVALKGKQGTKEYYF